MSVFPYYRQLNAMDCGPTCLRMIAKYHGKHYYAETLRQLAGFGRSGVSLLGISEAAEKIGLKNIGVKIDFQELQRMPVPCILHWGENHFVVLVSIKIYGNGKGNITVADPAKGLISFSVAEFLQFWQPDKNADSVKLGTALLLEPTTNFFSAKGEKEKILNWRLITFEFWEKRRKLCQIFLTLLVGCFLQLIFPFLAQNIFDKGINAKNLHFVTIILFAQLALTFGQTILAFFRSRLLLQLSSAIDLKILSGFWIKLTRLPVSYFDIHHTGDTIQRINDHRRIQEFLTGTAISTIFSLFTLIVYSVALVYYNVTLFIIFCAGSTLYITWIKYFSKFRRKLNYETFHIASKENNATLQLIQGMQEIRLHNAEEQKRNEWQKLQQSIAHLNRKNLKFSQTQEFGGIFVSQAQGILISFTVAKFVISGTLTFGEMLAIQFIVGQLNGPIQQLMGFMQSYQDAKLSMERLNEIHSLDDEEIPGKSYMEELPSDKTININNLTFTYPGSGNETVLNNLTLVVPSGKVTAIVGASGSGKTTLLKILLKVYDKYNGSIKLGLRSPGDVDTNSVKFEDVSHRYWRSVCGAVLQEGFIFNDSIARNIAVGKRDIDMDRLETSIHIANIHSFIELLPNAFDTNLGVDGVGLSQGQKQRILIARAVYKNPMFLFFDEATNALDTNNERIIVENLKKYFIGKTVLVVAHRLSTVMHADKIVVMDKGRIVEEGSHLELVKLKGKYYDLIKEQLELNKKISAV